MNCTKCELRKARFLAAGLLSEGWSLSRICAFLSNRFGEKYYESDGEIYRWNKIPPFDPHRITNYES